MSSLIEKKRELLPQLNNIIAAFASLSGDIAKLEISDNEQASKRVRKALISIRNIDLKILQDEIADIRLDINISKGRPIKRRKKKRKPKTENQQQNQLLT